MPSSKGKPTDPELREKIKEDIQNEPTSKDGSGKGGWAAWKASKLSKEYEAQGGGYENAPGTKNEPKKGTPEPKSSSKKEDEVKDAGANGDAEVPEEASKEAKEVKETKETKKAGGKKGAAASEKKDGGEEKKAGRGRPAKGTGSGTTKKKEKKEPAQGTRRSERVSKREAEAEKPEAASKKQKK